MQGLSLVAASGGHSSSQCAGLSLSRPLLLWSTGSRRAGSVIVAHGPSCSVACGIFPDQGSNPCPIGRQILNHCATREALHYLLKKVDVKFNLHIKTEIVQYVKLCFTFNGINIISISLFFCFCNVENSFTTI